jgi:hypothetical protein
MFRGDNVSFLLVGEVAVVERVAVAGTRACPRDPRLATPTGNHPVRWRDITKSRPSNGGPIGAKFR